VVRAMSLERAGELKRETSSTTSDSRDDSADEVDEQSRNRASAGGPGGQIVERKVASNQSMLDEETVCVILSLHCAWPCSLPGSAQCASSTIYASPVHS
jgi:hypothetical protein